MITLEEACQKYGTLFGWTTNPDRHYMVKFFQEIKDEFKHPMRMVEVGTFMGGTARAMAALTGGNVICIDNWKDFHPNDKYETGQQAFWDIIKNYGPDLSPQISLIEGDSNEIGKSWIDPIDLIIIDGDHSYQGAFNDMKNFIPHVVVGGYILIDDYDMNEVKQATIDYSRKGNFKVINIPTGGTNGSKLYVIKKL